jgi:sensor histidine kinase YesM
MRFKDNLSFTIDISENVPLQTSVPKMMIQMHVENALKHGISKLSKPGRIDIKIWIENEMVYFTIADNGIGRQNAAQFNIPSTKKGIKMLEAVYESLNLVNKLKIAQRIIDSKDDNNNPLGHTRQLNSISFISC